MTIGQFVLADRELLVDLVFLPSHDSKKSVSLKKIENLDVLAAYDFVVEKTVAQDILPSPNAIRGFSKDDFVLWRMDRR